MQKMVSGLWAVLGVKVFALELPANSALMLFHLN
jgi:hypothetical protein